MGSSGCPQPPSLTEPVSVLSLPCPLTRVALGTYRECETISLGPCEHSTCS